MKNQDADLHLREACAETVLWLGLLQSLGYYDHRKSSQVQVPSECE